MTKSIILAITLLVSSLALCNHAQAESTAKCGEACGVSTFITEFSPQFIQLYCVGDLQREFRVCQGGTGPGYTIHFCLCVSSGDGCHYESGGTSEPPDNQIHEDNNCRFKISQGETPSASSCELVGTQGCSPAP